MTNRNLVHALADLKTAREERAVAAAVLKEVDNTIDALEQEIMALMGTAGGLKKAEGAGLKVSLETSIVPQGKDWPVLEEFIHRNKAYYLFERRIHTKAWRELIEQRGGKAVPGIEPFERIYLKVSNAD